MGGEPTGELGRELQARRERLDDIQRRMESIRSGLSEELRRNWTSPWMSDETLAAKLDARLAGHSEYQSLRARRREAEQELESLERQLEREAGA